MQNESGWIDLAKSYVHARRELGEGISISEHWPHQFLLYAKLLSVVNGKRAQTVGAGKIDTYFYMAISILHLSVRPSVHPFICVLAVFVLSPCLAGLVRQNPVQSQGSPLIKP